MANTTLGLIVWLAIAIAYVGAVRGLIQESRSDEPTPTADESSSRAVDEPRLIVADDLAQRRDLRRRAGHRPLGARETLGRPVARGLTSS